MTPRPHARPRVGPRLSVRPATAPHLCPLMPTKLRFENGRPAPVDVCPVCGCQRERAPDDADCEWVCPACDTPDA